MRPVQDRSGSHSSARQETAGGIDVWPVVTTLRANKDDDRQSAAALLFGRVRFGASLPPAPEWFARVSIGGGRVGVGVGALWGA
jgi:hypothetical protein